MYIFQSDIKIVFTRTRFILRRNKHYPCCVQNFKIAINLTLHFKTEEKAIVLTVCTYEFYNGCFLYSASMCMSIYLQCLFTSRPQTQRTCQLYPSLLNFPLLPHSFPCFSFPVEALIAGFRVQTTLPHKKFCQQISGNSVGGWITRWPQKERYLRAQCKEAWDNITSHSSKLADFCRVHCRKPIWKFLIVVVFLPPSPSPTHSPLSNFNQHASPCTVIFMKQEGTYHLCLSNVNSWVMNTYLPHNMFRL